MQRKSIKAVYERLNLNYKAICHVTRGSSARMAEFAGAEDNHIRRQGRWNSQAMENCYLTTIPREAVRGLAGFDPKRPCFCLPRSSLLPPKILLDMVFPWIDEWTAKRESGLVVPTICLDSFLMAMNFLRIVLLQDSVILKERLPNLFIWNNSIFTSPEYQVFQKELKACMEKAINQDDVRIREVLPALNSHLRDEFSSLRSAVLANHAVITRTSDSVANLSKTVSGVLSGKAFLKINLNASDADVPSENGLINTDSPDKVTCVQGEAGINDLLLCRLMILLTCINFPYSGFIIIKREDKSCFVRSPQLYNESRNFYSS